MTSFWEESKAGGLLSSVSSSERAPPVQECRCSSEQNKEKETSH